MNWTELVEAVAELSPDAERQLLDEAHRQRSAATVPGPDTEHPPVSDAAPSGTAQTHPAAADAPSADEASPGETTPADPESIAAETPTAETPSVPADIVRPAETPAAGWAFSTGSPTTPLSTPSGLPRDDGVPTMDEIREKIEGRWARAEGQAILDAESEAGHQRADDEQARAKAAEDVLAKIRASINKP